MNLDEEWDEDDWWPEYEDKRIYQLDCAYCGARMKRYRFTFTCPECGCRCFTDEDGNKEWNTEQFKFSPTKLITEKQKRAVWICNHYGGRDFFTLDKSKAHEFLKKYFEESCAMKEAATSQYYEELAEEGLLPDESEFF